MGRHYEMPLAAQTSEARRARTHVRAQLGLWDLDGSEALVERAELLVTELVANAVRHGTMPEALRLTFDGALTIEVTDANPHPPRPRHAAWDDDGGRGLELVELMSDKWGWEPRPTGKNVWAQLWP